MRKIQSRRILDAAIEAVLDWYCHSDGPAPEWWRTTGPYNIILLILEG